MDIGIQSDNKFFWQFDGIIEVCYINWSFHIERFAKGFYCKPLFFTPIPIIGDQQPILGEAERKAEKVGMDLFQLR